MTLSAILTELGLSPITDPMGYRVEFGYNEMGWRVYRKDGLGRITRYAYDDLGRLTLVTYPDGSVVTYAYDGMGNLVQMRDSTGVTEWEYEGSRQVNPNGSVEEMVYDEAGQVREIWHKKSSGEVFGYLNYGYNLDGLVREVVEGDGSVVSYEYDPLFRLVLEERMGRYPYMVSYEYDGAGNRVARVWNGERTDYLYDAADRLEFYVKQDGSVVAYEWDANGNMVGRVEGERRTQFEYDFDNRLIKIVYPDGREVRYGYDGLGRRVWRGEGGRVRYFFYDGDRIIAEREGNSWVVRYLLGRGPVGFVAGGGLRVYHGDRLGSVRWVTDGEQNLVVSYVYEGFGKIVGQEGGDGGPYQWCGLWGYRNDHDGGLIHVGARYYEIETGRWVQKDPVLSKNPYLYCINNPVNLIDPKGLWYVELSVGVDLPLKPFSVEFSFAFGTTPNGKLGLAISVELEFGRSLYPIDWNISISLGHLSEGWFVEFDAFLGLGGKLARYIGRDYSFSYGIGTPQVEVGVGYTWVLTF